MHKSTDLDNPAQGTADLAGKWRAPQPACSSCAKLSKQRYRIPDTQTAASKDNGDDGSHALLMSALMDMKSEYAKLAGLFSQNMQQLNKATRWAFS